MAEAENDLVSRSIRFLKQQQEMYGDFSVDIDSKSTSEINTNEVEENEIESVSQQLVKEPTPIVSRPKKELTEAELIEQCSTLDELKELCVNSDSLKTDLPNTNLVFGVGNTNADLMIIGEAPGFHEDQKGEPFVGEAGQLLDKIMAAINFKRDDIYIANILKHRPPDNRDPNLEERTRSLPFLHKQIELVNPKLILCVGRVSANTLLNKNDSLKSLRSKFHLFGNRELMVTYHPAALLRNQQWKRPTWEDVQLLRKRYNELNGKP